MQMIVSFCLAPTNRDKIDDRPSSQLVKKISARPAGSGAIA
jgi:hypothetical protein